MPYDVDIGDGADALGQNQLSDALDGTYWVSGWDATLGTGDLEVDIAAGDGAVDGADVSTASTQTIDFTGDPDGTDPRKAVIYVDSGGTVQKSLGTPQPVDPSGEVRFRTYNPSPPASVSGVVVAEVWLAAGETVLESDDVRDRRVANQAAVNLGQFSLVANGYDSKTRSIGTEYTNNTNNPIHLEIEVQTEEQTSLFTVNLLIDSSTVVSKSRKLSTGQYDTGHGVSISAIVPDGSTYKLETFFANFSVDRWYEQELTVQ